MTLKRKENPAYSDNVFNLACFIYIKILPANYINMRLRKYKVQNIKYKFKGLIIRRDKFFLTSAASQCHFEVKVQFC